MPGTRRVLSSAWDGIIKLWERPEEVDPEGRDPFGLEWTIVWECVGRPAGYAPHREGSNRVRVAGKCPLMLNPAHPSWMLCVGWADMTNPHSLWVWDTDPPPKV